MKTKEELNTLKQEVETLNKKLAELSEEELVGDRRSECYTCDLCKYQRGR